MPLAASRATAIHRVAIECSTSLHCAALLDEAVVGATGVHRLPLRGSPRVRAHAEVSMATPSAGAACALVTLSFAAATCGGCLGFQTQRARRQKVPQGVRSRTRRCACDLAHDTVSVYTCMHVRMRRHVHSFTCASASVRVLVHLCVPLHVCVCRHVWADCFSPWRSWGDSSCS